VPEPTARRQVDNPRLNPYAGHVDLYDLLGIGRGASAAEVRRAYQKKARQFHPALNPGDPVAVERFQAIARAFDVLSDARRRAAYDRGEEPVVVTAYTQVLFEGFDFSTERAAAANFRDLFETPDAPCARTPAMRGEDLEQSARISFEESLKGAKRRVQVVRHERCPTCGGEGTVTAQPEQPCPRCEGNGQLRARRGHMVFSRTCGECGGRGTTTERPCPRCGGEGRLIESEWLDVEIPPGAGDGSRVRLPGLGNAGRGEGAAGDLTLVVEVESHPFFRREGDDLSCELPITLTEAALGGHVEVPIPEGSVTIEIPAGTQSGQRFRLRRRGAPQLGGKDRGDLWVEVRVVVPTVIDERGRALLKEVGELYPANPRQEAKGGTRS
jgi:molecular chaperone DnaJ